MQSYRSYHLRGDGHIFQGEWFDAKDDGDALERMRAQRFGHVVEVWQRARRIGRVDAVDASLRSNAA